MKIKKTLIAQGRWGRNFTVGRSQPIKYIVIHNTGTSAPADNNVRYFASRYVGASAHLFIDANGDVYRSVNDKDTAWAVGAKKYRHKNARNSNTINIEVVSAGTAFNQAQINSLNTVVRYYMNKYGIPADNVIRHYDVTGKSCPAAYTGATWAGLRGSITGTPVKPVATKPAPSKPAVTNKAPKYTPPALRAVKIGSRWRATSKRHATTVWQQQMRNRGWRITVDGWYGEQSRDVAIKFQREKGLLVDGIVGKNTWDATWNAKIT